MRQSVFKNPRRLGVVKNFMVAPCSVVEGIVLILLAALYLNRKAVGDVGQRDAKSSHRSRKPPSSRGWVVIA